MKKAIFAILISFLMIVNINADCEYSHLVELNTYASHVKYTYDYNESTGLFDITLTNVVEQLKVLYNGGIHSKDGTKVVIRNIEEGQYIRILIISDDYLCIDKNLRVIYITLPYPNLYYNSEECKNYMNLIVCNSKFLNYRLTYANFKSILKEYDERNKKEEITPEEDDQEEPNESIFDIIYTMIKKYWIEVSLVAGSTVITIFIGNFVYKRVKYKL